jgi:alpha-N-arabinofuranosidase
MFNQHSDIVCMANLAQAVNVLQALLLTEGEKLVKTPTYHVFDLFKAHQDSELVYSFLEEERVKGIPAISQSASVDALGHLTITLANCSLEEDYELEIRIVGHTPGDVTARILTGDVHDYNDFENAEHVRIISHAVQQTGQGIQVVLPKCSVVEIRA